MDLTQKSVFATEDAARGCALAYDFEAAGEYLLAVAALGSLWQGVGIRPPVNSLPKQLAAEALHLVGRLTSWLGAASHLKGSQELALDLISEAARLWNELGETDKYYEARNSEAICYWRIGAHEEGRIAINSFLPKVAANSELEFNAILTLAIIDQTEKKFNDMFRLLENKAVQVEALSNPNLKGRFHNTFALAYKGLGITDRALEEYAAASYYFEEARHYRFKARVENNLGFLLLNLGRYTEAHTHLKKARELFVAVKDEGSTAQVDETRARVFIAEDNFEQAEEAARAAVNILEQGEEYALFVEALVTLGIVLGQAGNVAEALQVLSRAHFIASDRLGSEQANQVGRALVTTLASKLFFNGGVTLDDAVRLVEHDLIKEALSATEGNVTAAAFRLGMKNYQTLQKKINTSHQDLLSARSPVVPRKKSIMLKKPRGYKPLAGNVSNIADKRK